MADKKRAADQAVAGGNDKSSGKSAGGGRAADPARNTRLKGQDPSPDNRRRGEVSEADRA